MSVHLNDLSKVYLNNILESSCEDDEPKMKKSKKKNNEMEDDEIEEALDPVGQEDSDPDNDGNPNDPNDKYIMKRRKAIGKAIAKRDVKEGLSNWRNDLIEVIEPERLPSKMKEGNVDNYNGKNKCVTINPEVKEQVQILESVELSEEYVDQIIDLASQYFYSEGYDEESVKIIAEGMGHDEFVDFIFDIGNTFFLDEAAYQGELLTSTGKARKNPKVSAAKGASTPVAHTPSSAEKKKPEEKKSSPGQLSINYNKKPSPPGQERIIQAVGNAVQSATSPQTRQAVGKAAGSAVNSAANTAARAALSAWKGHKEAMKRKGEGATVAQQVGAGLGAAAGAFFKKGKEHLKNSYEFADWLEYIVSEGCDISEWTINNLYKQYKLNEAVYGNLNEKATSEQQQKLFGLALSVKRGETPRSEASDEVLKIVDSMSEKKIRDFAKTKHEGIPKKVEENLQPTTAKQVAAQQELTRAAKKVFTADTQALQQIKKTTKPKTKDDAIEEEKTPVTRQAGDFRYSGRTGQEKAERRVAALRRRNTTADSRRANTIEKRIKTVADRDTAQASSDARQKLYRGQQRRANDLAQQNIRLRQGNVNAGYEPDGNLVDETKKPSALDLVRQRTIAQHGAASIMGTPENKAATEKRAAAKKPQPKPTEKYKDDVYSKDGLGGIRGYRSGD